MRASQPSRRLRSRPPRHRCDGLALSAAVVHLVDEALAGDDQGHVAFHATVEGDEVALGLRPIAAGVHPFTELAGLVAPESWQVFGLRVQGIGHHLDDGTRRRATSIFAVDRHGGEAALLHDGDRRIEPGPGAVGTIPDLCRRVLGRPTPPAPARTRLLFAVAWLDRVLDAWGDPMQRRRLMTSFGAVAGLHPAVRDAAGPPAEAAGLARLADEHAAAWPWSRLRAEPEGLVPPDGGLPAHITTWMDDGAYARWLFGAYPDPGQLAPDVISLLGPVVGAEVQAALVSLLEERA
ncbi:MAG: hypothetical protein ACLGI8_02155 [Acidimicrobiia bacterium]|jgi:hypothetical protein